MIPSRLSLSLSIAYAFDVLLFTGVPFSAGFLFDTFVFLRCGSVLNQMKLDGVFYDYANFGFSFSKKKPRRQCERLSSVMTFSRECFRSIRGYRAHIFKVPPEPF